jgi:hypothetical protein
MYYCPERQVVLARFPPSSPASSKLVLIKCPLTTEVVASISSRNPEEVKCSIPVSEYTDMKGFILLHRKNLSEALLPCPKADLYCKRASCDRSGPAQVVAGILTSQFANAAISICAPQHIEHIRRSCELVARQHRVDDPRQSSRTRKMEEWISAAG